MRDSERKKALIRIGTAYVNGETPDPLDIEIAKRSTKGGRPGGETFEHFQMKVSIAWCYFYARAQKNMNPDEALSDAIKAWPDHSNVGRDSLKEFCSYLKSGKSPTDPRKRFLLEHSRAALRQVDRKYGNAESLKFLEAYRLKCETEQINDPNI